MSANLENAADEWNLCVQGETGMKVERMLITTKTSQPPDVQQEVDNFLRAISSYPDRFARDPGVSFEQHLGSIVASEAGHLSQH